MKDLPLSFHFIKLKFIVQIYFSDEIFFAFLFHDLLDVGLDSLRVPHVEHVPHLSDEQVKPGVCEKFAESESLLKKHLFLFLHPISKDLFFPVFKSFVREIACGAVEFILAVELFNHAKLLWIAGLKALLKFFLLVPVLAVLANLTQFFRPKNNFLHTVFQLLLFLLAAKLQKFIFLGEDANSRLDVLKFDRFWKMLGFCPLLFEIYEI